MAHSHATRHTAAFVIGIALNTVFVAVEVAYGLLANSSALLADAGHNASDVLGLVFAFTAARLATVKPSGKYTYGFRKTTILVSILNALLLFGAVIAIGWEAAGKFRSPEPVAGTQVMIVAGIGVVINSVTALLFMKGRKQDLNIRGAFLHMAADAGVSLGVVVSGLLITVTSVLWIDPVMSFLIILVIVRGTWKLFSDALDLVLDAVPKHIQLSDVRDFLRAREGVEEIHDLHVWALSTTQVALTVHLVMPGGHSDAFISVLQRELEERFEIDHTTVQVEHEAIDGDGSEE